MGYTTFLVIVTACLLLQHLTTYVECGNCTLTIKDSDNNDISNSDLCMYEYKKPVCSDFFSSFNRSILPTEFSLDTLTVERPSGISLVSLLSNYEVNKVHYNWPGLRIKWEPPTSENSRQHLDGYLMIWQNETTAMCRIFQLNRASSYAVKKVTFSFDVKYLNSANNYTVTVYSIPTPDAEFKEDENRFVRMRMTSFVGYKNTTDPARWTPSVSTKTWANGTIEVRFTLSPPEFNLTQFRVLLVKQSYDLNNFFQERNYTGKLYTDSDPEAFLTFDNLDSDKYQVVVKPIDVFAGIKGQCLCWKIVEYSSDCDADRCCENICEFTTTAWISLIVTEAPVRSTTPKQDPLTTAKNSSPKDDPTTAKITQPTEDSLTAGEIVGISIGVLCFLVLVIIPCLCFRGKLRIPSLARKFTPLSDWYKSIKPPITDLKGDPEVKDNLSSDHQVLLPSLKQKKLYFMSADDHSKHIDMVESLVHFLELHCHCNVVYPPRAEDIHNFDSPYSWFINHISSSDYIIFVNSVAAQKLIEANLNKTVYRNRVLGPEGDLFTECVKHIFKDNKARDKVINIYFGNNYRESKYITSPFTFPIPRNLPELIKKLHAINAKDTEMFSNKLPMLRENIAQLPGGSELRVAIESSSLYEQESPDWLDECYGTATPISIEPMLSHTSGDSGIVIDMGPRSVSSSDLVTLEKSHQSEDCVNEKDLNSVYTVSCSVYDEINPPEAIDRCSSLTAAFQGINQRNDTTSPSFVVPADTTSSVDNKGESLKMNRESAGLENIYEMTPDDFLQTHNFSPSLMYIQPPDTMSTVDYNSEALMDINRDSDLYFNDHVQDLGSGEEPC
ncbi:hypothetical protein Bpfe_025807 [Biomphalaria pfeifferi]|uniref:SEFIR domain-containing protein n=1 Tax=Biomphalaria pfeifferi TaxID=112525 RepID=A0AAD8EY40_BIOPF|nr:hypothetical protein Bpfe_025807 [Biomphalaria pfeifferi]